PPRNRCAGKAGARTSITSHELFSDRPPRARRRLPRIIRAHRTGSPLTRPRCSEQYRRTKARPPVATPLETKGGGDEKTTDRRRRVVSSAAGRSSSPTPRPCEELSGLVRQQRLPLPVQGRG